MAAEEVPRVEQLLKFQSEMASFLLALYKDNIISETVMFERNVIVNTYIASLREGCAIATEIKDNFSFYLMFLQGNDQPEQMQTYLSRLTSQAEQYVAKLKLQMEKQQTMFAKVLAIIDSFAVPPQLNSLQGLMKVGINFVVKMELDALELVCRVYHALIHNRQVSAVNS